MRAKAIWSFSYLFCENRSGTAVSVFSFVSLAGRTFALRRGMFRSCIIVNERSLVNPFRDFTLRCRQRPELRISRGIFCFWEMTVYGMICIDADAMIRECIGSAEEILRGKEKPEVPDERL